MNYDDLINKGWKIRVFDNGIFKEFADILLEDIRKYGFIDKDGSMSIDDGIQKQVIGQTHNV